MHSLNTGAQNAPSVSPEILRRARVLARVSVSPAVAGVLAGLAFPGEERGDAVTLSSLTADRTGAVHV